MKGEYFKMKNHGLRRIFSLFLALFMVFTLLPTTALAEDTTGADETQPKAVVVDEGEKKTDPSAPEDPKTFTVTYTDGETAQYLTSRFTATCRPVPRPPLSAAPLPGKAIPSSAGSLKSPKP